MLKSQIKIGGVYSAKVSGNHTHVRVDNVHPRGGWWVTNLNTNRQIHVKTAARLRAEVPQENGRQQQVQQVEQEQTKTESKSSSGLAAHLSQQTEPNTLPHAIVRAYAGTGKTTTLMTALVEAYDCWEVTNRITPSDEQAAVWDVIGQGKGKEKSIVYCAFNNSIVQDFGAKWSKLVDALAAKRVSLRFATVNSLGHRCVLSAYGNVRVTTFHTDNLLGELTGRDTRELQRNDSLFYKATIALVEKCKLSLAGWTEETGFNADSITEEVLDVLAAHYDIDMNGQRDRVYQTVPALLRMSTEVSKYREIDFNDQNWLPIVCNLPIEKCDLAMVDEAQDLPRCKQEFVRRMGRRCIVVGDVHQAIYGFAGADVDSIPRMESLLQQDSCGVVQLKLTETRRCGKAIVALAQQIVPDFTAHESNCDGEVCNASCDKLAELSQDGDMVLSRVNAPLVSSALRLIKQGRKAIIRGRDFGKSLVEFIARMRAKDVSELIEKISDWGQLEAQKESRKRNPSEAKLIAIQDRVECIEAFCDGATSTEEVRSRINTVFAGKQCPRCRKQYGDDVATCYGCKCELETPKGVLFSSVHRAKGLEADSVFIILKNAPMPHPMAKTEWQRGQEMNLKYVAVTRAIQKLTWLS